MASSCFFDSFAGFMSFLLVKRAVSLDGVRFFTCHFKIGERKKAYFGGRTLTLLSVQI